MGLQFLFMDDNAPCHRTIAAQQLLEIEDIERRRLAARTLPPVTIRELRLALQDEWAAMLQQLLDTLILSMGRRFETCLAVREIISPTKDRMFLAGYPSQGCFGLQSHCAPCYFFNQASFYPSDFSFNDFMRGRIIGKIEEGRKITDVAREFDIAHSVVSRLWKSFKTTGMCSRRHGGCRVRRKVDLPKNCCQTFEGGGLYARRPVLCVPLTRQHRTARLLWCREHHNWTELDWACVLFSEESRFSLSSDCRRQLIWRESGTAYRPENIQEKDRYPTCSIKVWAGIMINGHTHLHVVANGTLTGQRYIDEVLLPHVRLFRGAVDSEGIQRLVWPARSPDLNPIENVWDALGRQVAGRNYPPTNKNTLIRALTEEWDKLPQQLLDNVVQNGDQFNSCQVIYSQFGLAIHQNDHQAKRRFVEWAQNEIAVVPDFHKRILFSDEAHFWLNGYVKKQNCRIWSEANPQVVTVNSDRYRAMITNFFIPELNNHDVQELWFQQDGATCHTARATIHLLKDTFGDRLISRFGPVNRPPRSCDLTPLDYFLWGYVKLLVYADKPQTLDHLEDNIRRVIGDIRPQMLEKVMETRTSRMHYIRASRCSPMPEIIFKM
ncbi:transposable element Tcb2 transposase [Trichonephila clavipes]|nr:transposable element Tcb2 transposase [Trichonephila clavipes]